MLSRGCYAVKVLELSAVPTSKRDDAIRLALAGWTPFAETAHYVIPQPDGAVLCAWDSAATSQLMDSVTVDVAQTTVVPESALRRFAPAAAFGKDATQVIAALYQVVEGVVGVVQVSGRMLAEQWWPDAPSPVNWRNFLRSASASEDISGETPSPTAPPWATKPDGHPAGQPRNNTSAREVLLVWVLALVLAVPTIWYANQLRQLSGLKQTASQRLQSTEKDLDVVLSAREQALSTQERASQLAALFNQTDALHLFALVNEVVLQNASAGTLQLNDWEMRPQQLKFSLIAVAGSPPAATALVKALERVQIFRDVEIRTDGSRLNVTLKYLPPGAPPIAVAPAAVAPVATPPRPLPKTQKTSSLNTRPIAPRLGAHA